jgi:tetratricopeptide (TPR) repeat protein
MASQQPPVPVTLEIIRVKGGPRPAAPPATGARERDLAAGPLEVGPQDGSRYHVTLRSSAVVGEKQSLAAGPLEIGDAERQKWKQFLKVYRKAVGNGEDALIQFGHERFTDLLETTGLIAAWSELRKGGGPLHLTLAFGEETEELAGLPFELLHDGHSYLFAQEDYRLVRSLVPTPVAAAFALPPRPRLVFAWACPPPEATFDPGPHQRTLATLKEKGLEVEECQNVSWAELEQRLRHGDRVDVLHLLAHGDTTAKSGWIHLCKKPSGAADPVPPDRFAHLLRDTNVPLVFLCSCHSAVAPSGLFSGLAQRILAQEGSRVACVVAMQAILLTESSAELVKHFYDRLLNGQSPAEALAGARFASYNPDGKAFWSVPILLARPLQEGATLSPDGHALVEVPHQLRRSYFVPTRTQFLERLCNALCGDGNPADAADGPARCVGIYGMGGIGKSVLASEVARHPLVHATFRDGIIWVQLKKETDVRDRLRSLYGSLTGGKTLGGTPNEPEYQDALRHVCKRKRILIILDDAWEADDIADFTVFASSGMAFLITSRDAGILSSADPIFSVELLDDQDSRKILAKSAGVPVEALPPEAEEVVGQCEGLALALVLCGGMIRKKSTDWSKLVVRLRTDLERISDRGEREGHRSIGVALEASLRDLDRSDRCRFLELCALIDDDGIPEAAVSALWEHTSALGDSLPLDAISCEDLLTNLLERSLVLDLTQDPKVAGASPGRRVELHNLVYVFATSLAKKEIGDDQTLNGHVVDAYREKCPIGWASGPRDAYFLSHLAQHLLRAGRHNELYALARDDAFLQLQAEILANRPDLPLRTLETALAAATRGYDPARMAEFQLRLARRVFVSKASSPLAALRLGNLDNALRLADLSGVEYVVLHRLLLVWELFDAGDTQEVQRILRDISGMELPELTDWKREYGAYLIAQVMPADPPRILELAARTLDANGLAELCVHLTGAGRLADALAILPKIKNPGPAERAAKEVSLAQARAGDLAGAEVTLANLKGNGPLRKLRKFIAQRLAEQGEVKKAFDLACWFEKADERSSVFLSICHTLLEAGRGVDIVRSVRKIKDDRVRSQAFYALVAAQAGRGDVYWAIRSFHHIRNRVYEERARQAIAAAQARSGDTPGMAYSLEKIEEAYRRAEAEGVVATVLAAGGQVEPARALFLEAVTRARKAGGLETQAKLLAILGTYQLEAGMAEEALKTFQLAARTARDAKNNWCLLTTFETLIKALADAGRIDEALDFARQIRQREPHYTFKTSIISGAVRQGLTEKAVQIAGAYKGAFRDKMMRALCDAFTAAGLPQKALETAAVIRNRDDRAQALRTVATYLAKQEAGPRAREVLASALFERWDPDDAALGQSRALTTISLAQSRAGYQSPSHESLYVAITKMTGMLIDPIRIRGLVNIQLACFQAGLADMAALALNRLSAELEGIEAPEFRGNMQSEAAAKLAQSGQVDLAGSLVENEKEPLNRSRILRAIAMQQALHGDPEAARAQFLAARGAAEEMKGAAIKQKGATIRSRTLQEIGIDQGRAGFFEEARATLAAAASETEKFDEFATRTKALQLIAADRQLIDSLESLAGAFPGPGAARQVSPPAPAPGVGSPLELEVSPDAQVEIPGVALAGGKETRLEALFTFAEDRLSRLPLEEARNLLMHTHWALGFVKGLKDWNQCAIRLVKLQVQAGLLDEALALSDLVVDENSQAEVLQLVASGYAQAGQGARAVKLCEKILVNRRVLLPRVAASLAHARDVEHFQMLLLPCAYYIDAALQMCGLLAALNPDASTDIAGLVASMDADLLVNSQSPYYGVLAERG